MEGRSAPSKPSQANLRGWIAPRCLCRPHWNWPRERGGSARSSAPAGDPVSGFPRWGCPAGSGLPRGACSANHGTSWRWPRASLAACLPACRRGCMSARKCCGMPARMARRPDARLHVCLFACRAICLPLPFARSGRRTHGELPPLGQNGQTQRRTIRHSGGGLSVSLCHRVRPGRAHARLHRQARGRGLLYSRPR